MQNSPENDKYIRVAVIAGLAEISVLYPTYQLKRNRWFISYCISAWKPFDLYQVNRRQHISVNEAKVLNESDVKPT